MTNAASDRVYNVLFLCTGNSARSILGEALMNAVPGGKFRAYSAGSQPKGEVHPLALHTLKEMDLPTEGYRSKSWDEFATPEAPKLDFVFTVCDNAAGEACPFWPGQPMTAHWGVEDPAAVEGSEIDKVSAFRNAANYLRRRIEVFAALPLATIDKMSLQAKLKDIGKLDGATDKASND
ncbi:arsenate reductase ArsC [Devosia marina]|uniref:Arsenate reductase ArsC n=1 Tax=Devosia marina TaxID=2683198 RepID=A0A7X3FSD9_9HYPH|nr:arsenate reductase ArsC [Devosia marina]MVS99869.1 arsenate reductase ArsC [Devosia marina]